jgi:hypothetical protein
MTEEEQDRLWELARLDDLKRIAGRPEGRRFLASMFLAANCFTPIYSKSADVYKDSAVQAFAIRIWKDIHRVNPEASRLIFDTIMTPPGGDEEMNNA